MDRGKDQLVVALSHIVPGSFLAGPKGGSKEVDKLLKDAQKQAAKAQENTIAVPWAEVAQVVGN